MFIYGGSCVSVAASYNEKETFARSSPEPCQKCTNCVKNIHLTLFTMGEIFIIVSIFSDICYFFKYMKIKLAF